MQLQEARRPEGAPSDGLAGGSPLPAVIVDTVAPTRAAAPSTSGLAMPVARGFDALGMGPSVVVYLPSDPAEAGPAPEPRLADQASAETGAVDRLPWPVWALKLLALAVALGCAWLAAQFLFGPPAARVTDAPMARVEPPR